MVTVTSWLWSFLCSCSNGHKSMITGLAPCTNLPEGSVLDIVFRVGLCRFCSNGNSTTLSILLCLVIPNFCPILIFRVETWTCKGTHSLLQEDLSSVPPVSPTQSFLRVLTVVKTVQWVHSASPLCPKVEPPSATMHPLVWTSKGSYSLT